MWPSETVLPPVRDNEAAARRHIRTVPTRLGVGLLVMVALLWLVGLNYQANLAYIAAFWLLGFIIVAVLQNRAQLLGLRLEVKMPSEIFAGTPAEITLDAAGNTRRRRLWLARDDGDGWQPWHIPGGSAFAVLSLQAQMRGYLRLPLLRVAAAAPFGICTTECRWQWRSDKVVFPAPEAHDPPAGFHADECGGVQAASARSSDDLSHLQAHQSGASLQHIAWKTYAKTGEMLDKNSKPPKRAAAAISFPIGTIPPRDGNSLPHCSATACSKPNVAASATNSNCPDAPSRRRKASAKSA